jgi:site-specific recombinase XerD
MEVAPPPLDRAEPLRRLAEQRRGQHPPNYGRTFPPEVLTPDEVRALIRACPARGPSGVRNRAIIAVLWRSGLRVGEAMALYPKDVDVAACTIRVLHGKGDKWRLIGVDPEAMAVLERWVECRRRLGVPPRAPLFCTIAANNLGHPVRTAYVRDMLKRVGRKAGIEKRVHPHGLRHTHAFELAQEGTPLHVIKAQLGHTSVATTERYIDHLAPVELIRAIQARSWPATNGNGNGH